MARKPYVLVVVHGGIADVALGGSKADVDILDMDNLKDTEPGRASLSDKEWEWLRDNWSEEYERVGKVTFTPAEEKAWEHYFREGKCMRYGDTRAAHYAWKQLQSDPDFPRLQYFHSARP